MTTHQRTRRLLIWRGSFSALSVCTFLFSTVYSRDFQELSCVQQGG